MTDTHTSSTQVFQQPKQLHQLKISNSSPPERDNEIFPLRNLSQDEVKTKTPSQLDWEGVSDGKTYLLNTQFLF
jgi:hypothetical protein